MNGEAALRYVRRGWSVVPVQSIGPGGCSCGQRDCTSPGKHPRVAWAPATEEAPGEEQIAEWWRRWPEANVGVVTGTVSDLMVLDVDPRNGGEESLAKLEAELGELPPTLASRTGGGGRHYWYAAPPLPLPNVDLAPGVELKAEGGMVVAPPSRHASGEAYVWENETVEPAPLPEWIIDRIQHPVYADRRPDPPPPRTPIEQEEFAEAWAEAGIELLAGDRYYLCPFHDDHHPSLHIDAKGCRWYCFGCRRGGGIGALRRLLGDPPSPRPRSRLQGTLDEGEPVTIAGEAEVEVVGESSFQDEILQLTGGRRRYGGVDVGAVASLRPRFEGVEVRIQGRPVGYLAPGDARRLAPEIEGALAGTGSATCRARIRGGWDRGGDDVGLFGVVLYLGEDTPGAVR